MTSMPASRSARAITLAPRSCPSRPGLATRTRIGFSSGIDTLLLQLLEGGRGRAPALPVRRTQLDQYTVGRLGMNEAEAGVGAGARGGVDQAHTRALQASELGVDIVGLHAEVVKAGAALRQVAAGGALVVEGMDDLQVDRAGAQDGDVLVPLGLVAVL